MNTDPIADMLTRIRNAGEAKKPDVQVPHSNAKERILKVLTEEGYIAAFERVENERGQAQFRVALKFTDIGEPVIQQIDRLSKPGRRVYVGVEGIPRCRGGLGTIIVSTSRGMLTDREARKQKLGGELVCSVF